VGLSAEQGEFNTKRAPLYVQRVSDRPHFIPSNFSMAMRMKKARVEDAGLGEFHQSRLKADY
jgi:hypothetical protein